MYKHLNLYYNTSMTIRRCLRCRGKVNASYALIGQWMAHTIKKKLEYHWTFDGVGRVETACGLWVWVELQD